MEVVKSKGAVSPATRATSIAANQISTDVSHALPTLPVTIYVNSESPDPGEQAAAWAAALILIAFVLVMNILAKLFAARKRRQLEGS
jgi:ABC-type phosphate transport system permease subunit